MSLRLNGGAYRIISPASAIVLHSDVEEVCARGSFGKLCARRPSLPAKLLSIKFELNTKLTNVFGFVADTYVRSFSSNKTWASSVARTRPDLFPSLAKGQSPEILWIGCSDSRCPETMILGLQPGDVFVHRNIANILTPTDLNSLSVIQYAVQYLKVKHIVVSGHTKCGGVAAAMANKKLGLIDTWLLPLRAVRRDNLKLLESLGPDEAALKLVELNVRAGVKVLEENPIVMDAMQERGLKIHGIIYDVASGELKELDIEEDEETVRTRKTAFKTDA